MDEVLDVVAQAWAESPARVVAAIALAPVVVIVGWLVLVVAIVAGSAA